MESWVGLGNKATYEVSVMNSFLFCTTSDLQACCHVSCPVSGSLHSCLQPLLPCGVCRGRESTLPPQCRVLPSCGSGSIPSGKTLLEKGEVKGQRAVASLQQCT